MTEDNHRTGFLLGVGMCAAGSVCGRAIYGITGGDPAGLQALDGFLATLFGAVAFVTFAVGMAVWEDRR